MARAGCAKGSAKFRACARLNLLDENFPADQVPLLNEWRIPFRQMGRDVACLGIGDDDILPLLHRFRRVTFFTLDKDFFQSRLCHRAYCLVWLEVRADDAADYIRRFLRHPRFHTQVQRMGVVARAHHDGVHFWRRGSDALQRSAWVRRRSSPAGKVWAARVHHQSKKLLILPHRLEFGAAAGKGVVVWPPVFGKEKPPPLEPTKFPDGGAEVVV